MPLYTFRFNNEPRLCERCKKKYKPTSANQKVCILCRKARMQERSKLHKIRVQKRREREMEYSYE
jgi:methionyl-tRNA synthetase